jgi:hypothetical protein
MEVLVIGYIRSIQKEKGRARTYMSESIPLSSALRIHDIQIIVANSTAQGLDLMLEDFTSKRRRLRHVGREAISPLASISTQSVERHTPTEPSPQS